MRVFVLSLVFALAACSAENVDDKRDLPRDIESLRALQREKQEALKTLEEELALIGERIREVDTTRRSQKRLVTAVPARRKDYKQFVTIQGQIESRNVVGVSSNMGGKIVHLSIEEGDAVRRGQLVAKIDAESLEKQRAELEKALELARDIYKRQANLWEQDIGSEVQYLEAKNNVERLEKNIETIDVQIRKAALYSPISGIVDVVNLKAGETASPGAAITMILDTRNVKVVADVPENYLGKVRKGDIVDIRFPALDQTMKAPVTLIGSKIDPANRTFKIEIFVDNTKGLLKPNLLTEVMINDYVEEDVLVISQELVQQEVGGKYYVMVVSHTDEGDVADKVYVTTGKSYEGDVIITEGLDESDLLIADGARGLTDGEEIQIVAPKEEESTDGK